MDLAERLRRLSRSAGPSNSAMNGLGTPCLPARRAEESRGPAASSCRTPRRASSAPAMPGSGGPGAVDLIKPRQWRGTGESIMAGMSYLPPNWGAEISSCLHSTIAKHESKVGCRTMFVPCGKLRFLDQGNNCHLDQKRPSPRVSGEQANHHPAGGKCRFNRSLFQTQQWGHKSVR